MSFKDILQWFNTPVKASPPLPSDINTINLKTLLYMTDSTPNSFLANYYVNMCGVNAYNYPKDKIAYFIKYLTNGQIPYLHAKAKAKDDIIKLIKERFPYLKDDDIDLLLTMVGNDSILEMLTGKNTPPNEDISTNSTIYTIDMLKQDIMVLLSKQCQSCPNRGNKIVLCDSDVNNLGDVKYLLIGEAPARDEIAQGKPFVGRAGKLLRSTLSELNFSNWLMWNVTLCFHAAGHTPTKGEIEHCAPAFNLVLSKLPSNVTLIPLGRTAMNTLGISDKVGNAMHQSYKYGKFLVLPNTHPSAVVRGGIPISDFKKRFAEIKGTMFNDTTINDVNIKRESDLAGYDGFMRFDAIYDYENVYLVLKKGTQKEIIKTDDIYTFWWSNNFYKYIMPQKQLHSSTISYKDRKMVNQKFTYYKELPIEVRRSIEFDLQNKQKQYPLNIGYFDIEVYTGRQREGRSILDMFDTAIINCLTIHFTQTNTYHTFVVGKPVEITTNNDNIVIKFFDNDKDLLEAFFTCLEENDPDILTGWNTSKFDWPFLIKRANFLGVQPRTKYSSIKIINKYNDLFMLGTAAVDYLDLYKKLAMIRRDSYRLDYIGKVELGDEMGKVQYDGSLDALYEKNLARFVEYNIQDTRILVKLEEKLQLIRLAQSMLSIANVPWRLLFSRTQLLDGLIATYLFKHNLAAYDKSPKNSHVEFQGAFVKNVTKGIFNWAIDLDLSSLYPYIIARCNLSPDTYYGSISENVAQYYVFKLGEEPNSVSVFTNNNIEKMDYAGFCKYIKSHKLIVLPNGKLFYRHDKEKSLFYDIIDLLITERKNLKNKMKTALKSKNQELYKRYDMMQTAYKVLTNALYGGFGAPFFRFFLVDMAASITAVGRNIIKFGSICADYFISQVVERKTFDIDFDDIGIPINMMDKDPDELQYILYNDTDSAFVHLEPVLKVINKDYQKMAVEDLSKLIIDLSNKLTEYINNYAIKQFLAAMNNTSKIARKYDFTFKQELVIKRIMFTGVKKRYVMWAVNREGVPIDDIKVVGIEIVRTDYSRFIRKALRELIDFILKTDDISYTKLLKYYRNIVARFDKLFKEGSIEIARPVGWNIGKEYKTIPRHVKGMLIYETLFDNKIFEIEAPRGYQFDITNINTSKIKNFDKKLKSLVEHNVVKNASDLDTIVIPDNMSHIDTTIFELDYDRMFTLNVTNRLTPILSLFGININTNNVYQVTW